MVLSSFDIFDTVLIRKCGAPANIFHITARRLFLGDEAKASVFEEWRKQAEDVACRSFGSRNVTLAQIYTAFDENVFGLTREKASGVEKDTEFDNLVLNPSVDEIIKRKREEGCRVCFISDMYLDSGFLREVLSAKGAIIPGEEVFVSCEYGARKSDGELFKIVKERYAPREWEHYGDNHISDYTRPRRLGVRSFKINTDYTDAEKYVRNKYRRHSSYSDLSAFVGFQRAARITRGNSSFAEIGADFVSSVYIPYVLYTLNQARNRGIKRLYFVNRDGYILMKIAEMFGCQYPDIELKYIFISRKSIKLLSLTKMDPSLLIEAQNPQTLIGKRVRNLLDALNVSRELLLEHGIAFNYDRIVTPAQEEDFLGKIFNSSLTPAVGDMSAGSREVFREYLEQEGVTDSVPCAMVDIGWYGSTRLILNRVLEHYGHRPVPFFYFMVVKNVLPEKYGEFYTYNDSGAERDAGLMPFLEQYFSACPYNTVESYKKENGKIVPVLEEHAQTADYRKIVAENIRTAEYIISCMKSMPYMDFDRAMESGADYLQLLNDMSVKINLDACTAAGSFSDTESNRNNSFVRKVGVRETLRYAFLGGRITASDRASISLTYGLRVSKKLFLLNRCSGRLRRFIYTRFVLGRTGEI